MLEPYSIGERATSEWHTKRQKIRESLNQLQLLDLALKKLLRYTSMHVHLENKSFYSINNLYHLVKNKLVLQCTDSCSNTEVVNTQKVVCSFILTPLSEYLQSKMTSTLKIF